MELSDDYLRLQNQRAGAIQRVASTPDGKELMRALRETFYDCPLMRDTSDRTAYAVGQRDVVQWLIDHLDLDVEPDNPADTGGETEDAPRG